MAELSVCKPIPPGFFDDPGMRTALAHYDFGAVFLAVRSHTGMSQLELADLLGLSQSRVSAVERGERRLTHVKLAARMATALRIPAQRFGFPSRPDELDNAHVKEASWLERRDFLNLVTAAALGSNLHPEISRLGELLPWSTEPVPRSRIGAADVDAIEAMTDGFRRLDLAHGGGFCRAAAIAQLQQVRRLRDAICSPAVQTRLVVATAELASTAGWMAYDVDDHNTARRLWAFALAEAQHSANHPRAADLAVGLLLDMAHQALHLQRPDEALRLTQLASATASNRQFPVNVITEGYISTVLGWCRASLDEPQAAVRAISQSQELYGRTEPGAVPPWASFVTDAEITAQQGHALYLLSLNRPEFAAEAADQLTFAVDEYSADHERSRAMVLAPLACTHFRNGDLTAAVATGHQAVSAIAELSSTRGRARLRVLDAVAAPFAPAPEIIELRQRIHSFLHSAA
ncbi:transcriptional regulator with XRE-family HTH domain [Actinoalloteichus hymeniacidonis]|nr:transcriptional regulator with XRE-family HTH domain [Actinoalloteichus hymeniacidonis]